MDETIKLRFKDRDKEFAESLTAIKQEAAAYGLLMSGGSVKRGHESLVTEFGKNRKTIVKTFGEYLAITKPHKIDQALIDKAFEILIERKVFLERYYKDHMRIVISSLKNQKMIIPYTTLDEQLELNQREMEIELTREAE